MARFHKTIDWLQRHMMPWLTLRMMSGLTLMTAAWVFPVPMGGLLSALAFIAGPWSRLRVYLVKNPLVEMVEHAFFGLFVFLTMLTQILASAALTRSGEPVPLHVLNMFCFFISILAAFACLCIAIAGCLWVIFKHSSGDDQDNRRRTRAPKPPRPSPTESVDDFFKKLWKSRPVPEQGQTKTPDLVHI